VNWLSVNAWASLSWLRGCARRFGGVPRVPPAVHRMRLCARGSRSALPRSGSGSRVTSAIRVRSSRLRSLLLVVDARQSPDRSAASFSNSDRAGKAAACAGPLPGPALPRRGRRVWFPTWSPECGQYRNRVTDRLGPGHQPRRCRERDLQSGSHVRQVVARVPIARQPAHIPHHHRDRRPGHFIPPADQLTSGAGDRERVSVTRFDPVGGPTVHHQRGAAGRAGEIVRCV